MSGTIKVTINGVDYDGSFTLSTHSQPPPPPPSGGNVPNAPVFSAGTPQSNSIPISLSAATSGAALDAGSFFVSYRVTGTTGAWTQAYAVPYITPGHAALIDTKGNTWTVSAAGNPVVGTFTDTASHCTFLYHINGTIWQVDPNNNWYSTTLAGPIGTSISWQGPATKSPLTSLQISNLIADTPYDLQATVSNMAGTSPVTSLSVRTAKAGSPPPPPATGGTGPTATSSFITADFQSPFNYPRGSGQQVVSPYCYGSHSSSWTDKIGQSGDYFANDTYMTMYGKINPGLQLHKSPSRIFNSNLTLNTGALANWANNVYKWFPDVPGGVVILPPGISSGNWPGVAPVSTSQYAQMLYDVANFFFNHTMANGQKFPLVGIGGEDECGAGESTLAGYYNAFIPRVKSVNPNLLIFGPTDPSPDMKDFGSQVPQLDVYTGNGFTNVHGNANSMDALNGWVANETGWASASGNLKYAGFSSGGSDWDCQGGQLFSYPEAMLHCKAMLGNLNSAKVGTVNCFWGGLADCGLMSYDPIIYPIGFWYAQGVRKVTGPRWQVPTNSGLSVVAVTPGSGRCSILVFNVGTGNKSGPVALSHWPVNSTGNGTANVWQMTSAANGPGKDGAYSTTTVTAGVTGSLAFPDPSITIISV